MLIQSSAVWLEGFSQDIRHAFSSLRRRPAALVGAAVTLGLGVAAAGLGAGALEQMLTRPLPFPDSGQLFTLYETQQNRSGYRTVSYPEVQALERALQGKAQVAAFTRVWASLGDVEQPTQLVGELVSPNYFSVLSVDALRGRFFVPGEQATDLVVLSYGLWQRQFGAVDDVVGRRITLNRDPYTVLGVAPSGFRGPAWEPEFWVPIAAQPKILAVDYDLLGKPDAHWLQTVGRLADGVTRARIASLVASRWTHSAGSEAEQLTAWTPVVLPANELRIYPLYRATVARFVGGFWVLSMLVLLTASANLATMLMAHAQTRGPEIAVRCALGATRGHLVRRLVAEIAVLGAAGTGFGLLLAALASPLVSRLPLPVPVVLQLTFDAGAAALALLAGLAGCGVVGLLVGIVELREGAFMLLRGGTTARAPRLAAVLVAAQVAGSTLLLIAMVLLLRSAWNTAAVDPGFDSAGVLSAEMVLDRRDYDAAGGNALYTDLRRQLDAQPVIERAAISSLMPLARIRSRVKATLPGVIDSPFDARLTAISPGYFELLRIPLLAGRSFSDADTPESGKVAIVNRSIAATVGADPIGMTIQLSWESEPRTIVGVAADIKYNSLTEAAIPFVYAPLVQQNWPAVVILIRANTPNPIIALPSLRAILAGLDPYIPLQNPRQLDEQIVAAGAQSRVNAGTAAVLGVVALLIAATGLYGMLSHNLAVRRREFAIRAAVGAPPQKLARAGLASGLRPVTAGLVAGVLGGFLVSGAMGTLLVGVTPHDPVSYGAAVLAVLLAAIAAGWIPARRAGNIRPWVALGGE